MKIYFSGSIRGGREHHEWYAYIVSELSKYGEVLSEFVADPKLTSYGQTHFTDSELYARDVALINSIDIFVADITTPSLGVGYEVASAEQAGKKIFCLYHKVGDKLPSSMILGNPNCKTFPYTNKEEIADIIKSIFE